MVGENDFGILAAHGQQFVHREGGGAEDGLEGDGVDASARSWRRVASEMRKEAVNRPTQTVRVLPLWVLV